MATTNNITTTYVGKDSGAFISPVLKSGLTLATPNVTIHNNVNYKSRITTLLAEGLIQDATCAFTPGGTITQDEVWLAVNALEVNLELCKVDYWNDFIGSDTGAWGGINNAGFMNYMTAYIGANVGADLETKIWQGVDGAGSFDGFETLFSTPDIAATPSASTIIADIRAMVAAGNKDLLAYPDLRVYLSSANYQFLMEANNDKGNASPCGENCLAIDGIQVAHAPGLSATAMVLARISNLHFGTWTNSDLNRLALIDQEPITGANNVNFVMKFFAGVQVGYRAEVIYSAAA